MESVRVRGCVVQAPRSSGVSGRQADASRRRNGPRKALALGVIARGGTPSTVRLSRKSCLAALVRHEDLREKGSSGTQAANPSAGGCGDEDQVGRADSATSRRPLIRLGRARPRQPGTTAQQEESMDVVVTGRHCELSERFRDHVADKLGRLEKHDHRIMRVQVRGRERAQPPPGRPCRPRRADGVLQGPGDPGRGRGRRQDGCPRPRGRQDGRPDATRRTTARRGPTPQPPVPPASLPTPRPSRRPPMTRSSPSARSAR